ncbi:FAD-dependent oxidoreductase [Snuella lapsa]|uniref:FAD-dependent oxidoreductase n=1 Tax=Snuella lapsa TaxID=870481 RepID=A0ABP6WM95_9FLAO
MKTSYCFLKHVSLILIIILSIVACKPETDYDIVVYGGTSAGIVAAVQATRMGKRVVVIVPDNHLGGLTTGGLGQTDIGNKHVIGGLSREFYQRIAQKYNTVEAWKWQERKDYKNHGQGVKEASGTSMWTFEPKVGSEVFNDMIQEHAIHVISHERLDLNQGVIKHQGAIQAIIMESGKKISGKVFIDATYEGDLMALSGIRYTVGREANAVYGETLNGVQVVHGIYHQFPDGVDPYIVQGDSASGLLPNVNKSAGDEGSGDEKVQGYCFRMCLTDVPENRLPVEKPMGYNDRDYELLFRAIEAGYNGPFFIMSAMPNRKTDSNNKGPFSSDFIGQNYDYPNADYKERERIIKAHEGYQKGLLWTLSNHPRVPEKIRDEFSRWGLPKDEFVNNGHWTPQLYIREARRMVSDFVMTEHHCTQDSISADQSVGMGAYMMDSHHVQRYVDANGFVKNEGDVEVGNFGPYPISYKALVPKRGECSNLIVPVCLSASHIAFGSLRMEPVFMVLGQSAATAACLAIDADADVQDVDYNLLKDRLLTDKQILQLE